MTKGQLSLIAGLIKNQKACEHFLEKDYPKQIFHDVSDKIQETFGSRQNLFLAHCALTYYEKHGELLTWGYITKNLKRLGASRPQVRKYQEVWDKLKESGKPKLGTWKENLEDTIDDYRQFRHKAITFQAADMYQLPCLGNYNKSNDKCDKCPYRTECRIKLKKEDEPTSTWILDWASSQIEQIKIDTRGTHIRVYDANAMMEEAITDLNLEREQVTEDGKYKIMGCPTPFPSLTKHIGGWLPKRIYIFGARTGEGKSAWLLQCANEAIINDYHVLYFNLEMPIEELRYRIMSYFCNFSFTSLMTKNISDKQMSMLKKKTEEIIGGWDHGRYQIVDIPTQTKLNTILRHTDNYLARVQSKKVILIIDYWNLLYCPPEVTNTPLWWAHQAEAFHAFSRSRGITGLAALQLNRMAEGVRKLLIKHVRDSDKMVDNFDGFWGLLALSEYMMKFQCLKGRYFKKLDLIVKRELDKMRFIERESKVEDDAEKEEEEMEMQEGFFTDAEKD